MPSFDLDPGSSADVARLLDDARSGSLAALGDLLDQCRQYLLLTANRELDDELRAKVGASDLVQDTLLKAHGNSAGFRGDTEAEWRAWLRRILLNHLANTRRSFYEAEARQLGREVPLDDPGRGPVELPAAGPSPSGSLRAAEEAKAVRQALERLPHDYREALRLRHQEGLAFEEVGRMLGRSTDAARKLWLRAVEMLKEELLRANRPAGG